MGWAPHDLDDGRRRLVDYLSRDPRITPDAIRAIAAVPRELFVPPSAIEHAYDDVALQIGDGATISAPSMVAEMLGALELEPGMRVLEIGAGSGYAAATLAAMGARVFGVELNPELAEQARRHLAAAGFSEEAVRIIAGDGGVGWPQDAPYDRILVSAAVEAVPPAWLEQLTVRGVLVYPEAGEGEDLLVRVRRDGSSHRREERGRCRFVRLKV